MNYEKQIRLFVLINFGMWLLAWISFVVLPLIGIRIGITQEVWLAIINNCLFLVSLVGLYRLKILALYLYIFGSLLYYVVSAFIYHTGHGSILVIGVLCGFIYSRRSALIP